MQNTSTLQTLPMKRAHEGLRERKKQKTRQALIEAAMRLYREKGFEGVTIAAIAEQADVAPRTFFSYFETKEDVFLSRGDERLERVVRAIQSRNRRQPILEAIHSVLLEDREPRRKGKSTEAPGLSGLLAHPAIANRLRERWNRWEDLLAEAIAKDVGARPGDPEPRVVAAALTGAIRVAAAAAREQPDRSRQIAERVFKLLSYGLSRYGAGK
ncbi:MAG: TetR family transcriptional regulator [Chloroflexi bacterium]|nr:MAG: TetR family transcriptional regulator [Chloroflexota bacterium]TMD82943.1 MAG: TetR family transcriptional regulator [Chloroflexota bacterium]